jgi:hypothetical protein
MRARSYLGSQAQASSVDTPPDTDPDRHRLWRRGAGLPTLAPVTITNGPLL